MPIKISYSTDSYWEWILIFNKKPLDRIFMIFMIFFHFQFPATGPLGLRPGGKKLETHSPPAAEIKG